MKALLIAGLPLILCSCASVNENNRYGFMPPPGLDADAQDRYNTKYNMMDSSDGSSDPTAEVKIWGAVY